MSLTMHRACVPMFKQTLAALSSMLHKAESFCADEGLDPEEFLQRRLAPDMFTLAQQIQRATFHTAQAVTKLCGLEAPDYGDSETTFDELQTRIQQAIDFLATFTPEQFDGSENRELEIQTRVALLPFIGGDFLFHFGIPQFLFHCTTAYDIIRNAGVEVGKRDFLGSADNR